MATAEAFFKTLETNVASVTTKDDILKFVKLSSDSIKSWLDIVLDKIITIGIKLDTVETHTKDLNQYVSGNISSIELLHKYGNDIKETTDSISTYFSKKWIETKNIFSNVTDKLKDIAKAKPIINAIKGVKKSTNAIEQDINVIIVNTKNSNAKISKVLKTINVDSFLKYQKYEKEMKKKYGPSPFKNTIGRISSWFGEASSDITSVMDWVKDKGIRVFSWFKNVAMKPLQALWDMTKTIAKIGWVALQSVYTVFSVPVNAIMSFIGKAIKTILFNPVVFIPLSIVIGMFAYRFYDLFSPVIKGIIQTVWGHIKSFMNKMLTIIKLSPMFNKMITTISGWIASFLELVFSEKNMTYIKSIIESIIGVPFNEIEAFVVSGYERIKEIVSNPWKSLWELFKRTVIKKVTDEWNKLLSLLGLQSNIQTVPSNSSGTVHELEKEAISAVTNYDNAESTIDRTVTPKIEQEYAHIDKNIDGELAKGESDISNQITSAVEQTTKDILEMQESKTSEMVHSGDKAFQELENTTMTEFDKGIAPEKARLDRSLQAIDKQKKFNTDMKNAIDNNTVIAPSTMSQYESDMNTARKSANIEKSGQEKQFESVMKTTTPTVSSINPHVRPAMTDSVPLSPININISPKLPISQIVTDKKINAATTNVVQNKNTSFNLSHEIREMEELGMGSEEIVSYIEDHAPHYKTMFDLMQWNNIVHRMKKTNDTSPGTQKILHDIENTIANLNSKLSRYNMAGSSTAYDALTPDMMTYKDGKLVLNNNWNADPIFNRILNSSYHNKGNSIPEAASGGVVTSPTLALIGEGMVSEIIIPLNEVGIGFITESVVRIIDNSNMLAKVSPENIDKNNVRRVISNMTGTADKTLYDMKLISSTKIGV